MEGSCFYIFIRLFSGFRPRSGFHREAISSNRKGGFHCISDEIKRDKEMTGFFMFNVTGLVFVLCLAACAPHCALRQYKNPASQKRNTVAYIS